MGGGGGKGGGRIRRTTKNSLRRYSRVIGLYVHVQTAETKEL
jgi:hypothetical protein